MKEPSVTELCIYFQTFLPLTAIDPCQRSNGGCPSRSTQCNYIHPGKVILAWNFRNVKNGILCFVLFGKFNFINGRWAWRGYYLVCKPLQAADILVDNVSGWEIVQKKKNLSEKWWLFFPLALFLFYLNSPRTIIINVDCGYTNCSLYLVRKFTQICIACFLLSIISYDFVNKQIFLFSNNHENAFSS